MHEASDPRCAPRPVAGAVLIVTDPAGKEAGRATTGADGSYRIPLAAGSYVLVAQPVAGLMHPPAPIAFSIAEGSTSFARIDVGYDTGIR